MRFSIFLAILTVCMLTSCKKITTFSIPVETDFEIPSGSPINLPFDIGTPPVKTNSASIFEQEKTKASLVESIKLSACKLEITSPDTREFDFVREIHVYLSASNQPEIEVAWITDINDSVGKTIDLQSGGANLKPYIIQDQFTLRLETVTDQVTTSKTNVHLTAEFAVKAGLK